MGNRVGNPHRVGACLAVFGVVVLLLSMFAGPVSAAVGLGTAEPFAVLGGSGVTNTGPTVINGDLGTCPTPAITGFPPGTVNGTVHADDAVACKAQDDTTTAYNDAAGRAPTTSYAGPTDLGGKTLVGGVYNTPSSFGITGTLTLDGQNNPDSTFIFQAGSTLITEPNSSVSLINGAQACNVFWQVGSSATLGVGSTFVGTVISLTSISANTNARIQGRLLARNGAVTLDSNVVTRPGCATGTTTSTAAGGGGGGGVTTSTTPGGGGNGGTGGGAGATTSTTPGGVGGGGANTPNTRAAVTVTDLPSFGASGTTSGTVRRSRTTASTVRRSKTTSTRKSIARTGEDSQRDVMLGSISLAVGLALTNLSRRRPRYVPRHALRNAYNQRP